MTTFESSWDEFDDEDLDEGALDDEPGPGGVLGTDEEVHAHLLGVVGPDRDGPRALWVLVLDELDRSLPLVIPMTDLPTMVDRTVVGDLARLLRRVLGEHNRDGSVAFALVRRGGGDRGTFEAGWSEALREAMAAVGVPVRAVVAIGRDRSRVLP